MNSILLTPSDVLFFRDGRPMSGSLAGHTAAWPLPTVTNAALHVALWRSGLAEEAHVHRRQDAHGSHEERSERFGSLVTAGPFPCLREGDTTDRVWHFPRPLDAILSEGTSPERILAPTPRSEDSASHLPLPFALASLRPPSKEIAPAWWSEAAWNVWLGSPQRPGSSALIAAVEDHTIADKEAMIGIGIDAATGAQDGKPFYAAQYLRLREGWHLGMFASMSEKDGTDARKDLLPKLLQAGPSVLVGGQQRSCRARLAPVTGRPPLPLGRSGDFVADDGVHRVSWTLLSPAIFPELTSADASIHHPGGWLPSWIAPRTHEVRLRRPVEPRGQRESRDAFRARVQAGAFISAQLVAALVGKPVPVTGWGLGMPDAPESEARAAGARPTHLAVPAGSVYYFSCDTADDARALAAALNWHGDGDGSRILRRRSTLLGEKGFGLGVCGTWSPHPAA